MKGLLAKFKRKESEQKKEKHSPKIGAIESEARLDTSQAEAGLSETQEQDVLKVDGKPFLKRAGLFTRREYQQQFQPTDSFVDRLPWVEFLDKEKALLLEDGRDRKSVV